MYWTARMATAAILMSIPAQAQAADWWLVAGDPGDSSAAFVDADTVERTEGEVTFVAQTILRNGKATVTTQRMRCDAPVAPGEREAMQRFACGTDEERMRSAMIIFPMAPLQAAQLIFAMPRRPETGHDDVRVTAR